MSNVECGMSRVGTGFMPTVRFAALAILLLGAIGGPFTAQAAGAGQSKYITFTILIQPRVSVYSNGVWGRVKSQLGTCNAGSCPNRMLPNQKLKFSEWTTSKKHPFQYWVLPNGTKDKNAKLTLSVAKTEGLTAQFKS